MKQLSGDEDLNVREEVGYRHPPHSTRFQKGRSGNERGRPKGSHRDIPYDTVLGQMVTIREDGRERRVTAAEAFILQLTRKGLAGDSGAARASLEAIESARARQAAVSEMTIMRILLMGMGMGTALKHLGLAIKRNSLDQEKVRWELQHWIVEAALARMTEGSLTKEEQREIWEATRTPEKVDWPQWWAAPERE